MATYNGTAHVAEQIRSFRSQTHGDWSLCVRDDGSSDATLAQAKAALAGASQAAVFESGAQRGPAHSFLTLLSQATIPADGYVALSDQDDVWFDDRLARAVATLAPVPDGVPALYCSRTILTDGAMTPLGPSRRHRKFTFRNAMVQNVVAGNTTVLNAAGLDLVHSAGVPDVAFHDWWLYLLFTGAGARIHYDPNPSLYYRQHGLNALGENRSLAARIRRANMVSNGEWGGWIDRNLQALRQISPLLTPPHARLISGLGDVSGTDRRARRRWITTLRPYRQSRTETAGLYASILSGRI